MPTSSTAGGVDGPSLPSLDLAELDEAPPGTRPIPHRQQSGRRTRVRCVLWRPKGVLAVLKEVHVPPEDTVTDVRLSAQRVALLEAARAAAGRRWPLVETLALRVDSPRHFQWLLRWGGAGTLRDVMAGGPLAAHAASEAAVRELLRSVVEALAILHGELRLVHGDVAPANVVIDVPGAAAAAAGSRLAATLGDLEGLRPIGDAAGWSGGTPLYTPPEALLDAARPAATETDIWAVGVLAFQLLSGSGPGGHPLLPPTAAGGGDADIWVLLDAVTAQSAAGERDSAHIAAVAAPRLQRTSEAAAAFVGRCLAWRPENRPTAAALLRSGWLA